MKTNMMKNNIIKKDMMEKIEEDISRQKPFVAGKIDRVGIEDLEIPVKVPTAGAGPAEQIRARVTAMVSLDNEDMRGIHMSRIYLCLHDFLEQQALNLSAVKSLLHELVKSQKGISKKAYLKFEWKWPVKRKALKSASLEGWRYYPVFYEGRLLEDKTEELTMGLAVTYSSTCPCSAGLARALIQKKYREDFASISDGALDRERVFKWLGKEQSISATPHAQKSMADIILKVTEEKQSLLSLIDEVESALGTPVQTAVKKADEQEFAKLNSENLMFSEDSARRIKNLLNQKPWVKDFYVHVRHFESLHPFEVACHVTKGVPGGFFA